MSVSKSKYASINPEGRFTAKRADTVYVTAATDTASNKIKVTIKPKKIVAIDAGHQARGDSSTEPVGTGSSSVSGASALYPSTANKYVSNLSKKSKKLSRNVLDSMCDMAGTRNRGLSARDDLTGTNWSTVPVTLIEMGFMTNPTEDRLMQTTGLYILPSDYLMRQE